MSEPGNQLTKGNLVEITPGSFLIFSLISVLAVPLAMTNSMSWPNFAILIYIGISITVIIGLILFVLLFALKNYFAKLKYKTHFAAMVLMCSIIGSIRGYLLYFSFNLGGYEQPTEMHLRLLTSTASTVFWLIAISMAVQDTHLYRAKFDRILKSSIIKIAREESFSSQQIVPEHISEEIQRIESTLNQTFDETIRSTINRESLLLAALQVRQTVDELVRPLSHRLWVDHLNYVPRVKLWATIIESVRFLQVQPLGISFFLSLISIFNLTSDYGALRGLIGSATVFIITLLSFKFLDEFLLEKSQGRILLNFIYLLLPGTFLGAVLYATNKYIFVNETGAISFVFIGLNFIVAVLSSTRELAKSDRNHLLASLRNDLKFADESLASSAPKSNAEVASFLHNSLQSELLALSYQLEDLANNPDPLKSKEVLEQLGSRINRSISRDFDDFVEDPLSRLKKLTSAWRGIAAISLTHDDLADLSPSKALLVVQIIEEAISNAVRYAKASNVSISIKQLADGTAKLVIINDGQSHSEGKGGLGTEWLQRHAAGKWSREIKDGQVTLELIL